MYVNRIKITQDTLHNIHPDDEIGIGICSEPEIIAEANLNYKDQPHFIYIAKLKKLEDVVVIDDSDSDTDTEMKNLIPVTSDCLIVKEEFKQKCNNINEETGEELNSPKLEKTNTGNNVTTSNTNTKQSINDADVSEVPENLISINNNTSTNVNDTACEHSTIINSNSNTTNKTVNASKISEVQFLNLNNSVNSVIDKDQSDKTIDLNTIKNKNVKNGVIRDVTVKLKKIDLVSAKIIDGKIIESDKNPKLDIITNTELNELQEKDLINDVVMNEVENEEKIQEQTVKCKPLPESEYSKPHYDVVDNCILINDDDDDDDGNMVLSQVSSCKKLFLFVYNF